MLQQYKYLIGQVDKYIVLMKKQQEQQPDIQIDGKIPSRRQHIQQLAIKLLKDVKLSSKFQIILMTSRAHQILTSIMTESQIYSCGYTRIVIVPELMANPYLNFEDVVIVAAFTIHPISYDHSDFPPCKCSDELSQISRQLQNVSIINLNISSSSEVIKAKLKSFQFRNQSKIKGYVEESLDFICYLNSVYKLCGKGENKLKIYQDQNEQESAIDRLCSYLFSDTISEFQFHIPVEMGSSSRVKSEEKANQFRGRLENAFQKKLGLLEKYHHPHCKKEGAYSTKVRVVVLERNEDLSPFIYSLNYGALTEELNLYSACTFLSAHSSIYNKLYHLDLLQAGAMIQKMAESITKNGKNNLQADNFKQTKKVILAAYNPNMSKDEVKVHQNALSEANSFVASNQQLIILQQSIANGISEVGRKMGGSKITEKVLDWACKNAEKGYQKYIGLVLMASLTHNFWWYQKSDLCSLVDKAHEKPLSVFRKRCASQKQYTLQEPTPTKDQNGKDVRMDLFRHEPNIIKQYQRWKSDSKTTHKAFSINKGGLSKKTRTILYIHSPISYGELAMLLKMGEDIQIVCRDLKNGQEWVHYCLQADF